MYMGGCQVIERPLQSVEILPTAEGEELVSRSTLKENESPRLTSWWDLRIIRNKYPVVYPEFSSYHLNNLFLSTNTLQGFFFFFFVLNGMVYEKNFEIDSVVAHGTHLVVVDSPLHNFRYSQSKSSGAIENLMKAFKSQGQVLKQDPMIKQILFFKNSGRKAGASIVHPHSQIGKDENSSIIPFSTNLW